MNISRNLEKPWVIEVNENINSLTDDEVKEVIKLIVENMVVVFKNQQLSMEDELRFCKISGRVQPTQSEKTKHISIAEGILRVTGKKDEEGKEGLFGHTYALDWHANQPSNESRHPLIWLYGVEGTAGSKTSWLNNIESYNGLPEDFKQRISNIEVFCGYKRGSYSDSEYFKEHVNKNNPVKLVQTNKAGKVGLFFPFLQIFGFKDHSDKEFNEIMDILVEHVLQEKYIYHHEWQDNDIVISEQWLSIHKRWEFQNMDKRILHRIAFDYSNTYN